MCVCLGWGVDFGSLQLLKFTGLRERGVPRNLRSERMHGRCEELEKSAVTTLLGGIGPELQVKELPLRNPKMNELWQV